MRSNQLSYRPVKNVVARCFKHSALHLYGDIKDNLSRLNRWRRAKTHRFRFASQGESELSRTFRYGYLGDFTPIICPTFGGWLHKGYPTDFGCYKLSWCDGRCVQGPGTYSPWHSDPRLLAIPASCRRVCGLQSELRIVLWD